MRHFKKNLLAEYKEQGSDESSLESTPPQSSSDEYEPGQESRRKSQSKTPVSSQSRKRPLPSKPSSSAGTSSHNRAVPGPSAQGRQQELSHNDSPRKRIRNRQVSPSESNYQSPPPSSPDLVMPSYDEDSQPQRSPGRRKRTTFESFHSSSPSHSFKSSSSSAYSFATPSTTRRELPSSHRTDLKQRRYRKRDNLLPDDCPLRRCDIVDLPIDDFNSLIETGNYNETQKAQFREWRRKGKNRVAAKKSREKRLIGIEQLKNVREKKIQTLEELDVEFAKLEKERLNLMKAVQTFIEHFRTST